MLLEPTLQILTELRLTGMATALERQQAMLDAQLLSFEERLSLLLEQERACRDQRCLTRLLQQAKLDQSAAIEDIDLRTPRGLDRSMVMRLAAMEWVRGHQALLITGATGTGKSYLASALGHGACRQGLATRYFRFSRLLGELALSRANGSYAKLLEKLAKIDLLILDDYGLSPLTDPERRDFLEVLEDRYGRRAT